MLKTTIAVAAGDAEAALAFAEQAVQVEPDGEDGLWALLLVHASAERYADAVSMLEILEDEFGYRFSVDDLELSPEYAGLARSSQFRDWIESRPEF